jgi:hypothetical protein
MFSFKRWRQILSNHRFQFWAIFLFLILIRFLPFFQGKTLIFGDNYSLEVPGKIFVADWLKQGVLPLWNPYIFSGIPTEMMDANQSTLYPSTLLFVIFNPAVALNVTIILHLLIAYTGMYLLSRTWLKDHPWSLVAAVLWMFSTQITGSMNNIATLQSIVWLPLLGYFGLKLVQDKASRLWFSLVVMIEFLGGFPQHVLYGLILAVLLSAFFHFKKMPFKQWFMSWFWTGLLTIGVAAVAWLPFIEALQVSTRTLQTESQALIGSLHPAMLVKFVLPYFFDNPADGVKWGPAWSGQPNVGIYLTWLGWLAVASTLFIKKQAIKREVWFFAALTIFTLVFSLGENLPGFSFIQKIMPFFRIARYPSMMMIVTNVVLALWTARGLQQWRLSQRAYRWLMALGGLALIVGGVGWVANQMWFEQLWSATDRFASFSLSTSPFHTLDRDKIIMFEIVRNIVFNSLFLLASIYLFFRKKAKLAVLLLAGVIGLDMIVNTHGQFFFAPQSVYDTASADSVQIASQLGIPATGFQYRLLTRNLNKPYTDYGSYWEALVVRAPFSDSFVDEQGLRDFAHPQQLRDGLTPNWNIGFSTPVINGYTTLLPIDYAQAWQHTAAEPRINFVAQIDPADPLLDEWSVRYYLVDRWFKVEEDLSALPVVGEYDRWQLLERPTALPRIRFASGSAPTLIDFQENPNHLNFSFENPTNEPNLIIADRYDKDWQIKLNDQPGTINNFNGMRQIALEPGINKVELTYRPKALYGGAILTFASVLGAGYLVFKKK